MRVRLEMSLRSESGSSAPLDLRNHFQKVYDSCKAELLDPPKQPHLKGDELTILRDNIHGMIIESFAQDSIPDRPDVADIIVQYENGVRPDFGYAVSRYSNSPKNFVFESLFCIGMRVYYSELEDYGDQRIPSFLGTIEEVIFTSGGQVRYSLKNSEGKVFSNLWGGWMSRFTQDVRSDIEATLGVTIIDKATYQVALTLDTSHGDAYHTIDYILNMMSQFCDERGVDFRLCPLECHMLFILLVDRLVRNRDACL